MDAAAEKAFAYEDKVATIREILDEPLLYDLLYDLTPISYDAFRCGPEATRDMLREMGECLRLFAEHRRSEKEAEELKQNGIKPH